MGKDNFLGDTQEYDILGVRNGFRSLCEKYVEILVESGKWFSCCYRVSKAQEDLMRIEKTGGIKLGSLVAERFPNCVYRTAIYRYFLLNYMCYVEVPTKKFNVDVKSSMQTFDKFLSTGCPEVMEYWSSMSEEEIANKFGSKIYALSMDDGSSNVPYVKLTVDRYGNQKLVNCRSELSLDEHGVRVIPVFMLKSGVDTLYKKIKEGIVKVTVMKDTGLLRDIYTTLDAKTIADIYGKGDFLEKSLSGGYDGRFLDNKSLGRGYINVPEIGGSRYDSPFRKISYSRIVCLAYNAEPDLSFINVDLKTVPVVWNKYLAENSSVAKDIWQAIKDYGITNEDLKFVDALALQDWFDKMHVTVGTVFDRSMCLFMMANPQWFGNYTGEPIEGYDYEATDSIGLL